MSTRAIVIAAELVRPSTWCFSGGSMMYLSEQQKDGGNRWVQAGRRVPGPTPGHLTRTLQVKV